MRIERGGELLRIAVGSPRPIYKTTATIRARVVCWRAGTDGRDRVRRAAGRHDMSFRCRSAGEVGSGQIRKRQETEAISAYATLVGACSRRARSMTGAFARNMDAGLESVKACASKDASHQLRTSVRSIVCALRRKITSRSRAV